MAAPKDTDLIRLAARAFGRLGGYARAKALSAEERKTIARRAAEARAKALTAQERKAIAKKAVRARLRRAKKVKRPQSTR